MAIVLYKNNTAPSLSDTIRVNGNPFDLTGSTVKLQMRLASAPDTDPLKIDAAAVVVTAALGTVRYDWAPADVDTAGDYAAWWRVNLAGGKVQDSDEFQVTIRSHGDAAYVYVELEQFKNTAGLEGTEFADQVILRELGTASRCIDQMCKRRFYADTDATQVRYAKPVTAQLARIPDLITLTSLQTDPDGNGVYDYTWSATDYSLEPLDAVADGRPYEAITTLPYGLYSFPTSYPRGIKVTGKFGWAAVPANIVTATELVASKLVKRLREAPFGIVTAGIEQGVAMRIARTDPDLPMLLTGYVRSGVPFV